MPSEANPATSTADQAGYGSRTCWARIHDVIKTHAAFTQHHFHLGEGLPDLLRRIG